MILCFKVFVMNEITAKYVNYMLAIHYHYQSKLLDKNLNMFKTVFVHENEHKDQPIANYT